MTTFAPAEVEQPIEDDVPEHDSPWVVIVWNDPINLMSYVTLVFQKLFGYSLEHATKLMLQVHNDGKSVVSAGTREKAELDVARLHAYGLWATMQQDSMLRTSIRRGPDGSVRLDLSEEERGLLRQVAARSCESCSARSLTTRRSAGSSQPPMRIRRASATTAS